MALCEVDLLRSTMANRDRWAESGAKTARVRRGGLLGVRGRGGGGGVQSKLKRKDCGAGAGGQLAAGKPGGRGVYK